MNYRDLADKIAAAEVEAFAWLANDDAETAKEMIVEALRGAHALNQLQYLPATETKRA